MVSYKCICILGRLEYIIVHHTERLQYFLYTDTLHYSRIFVICIVSYTQQFGTMNPTQHNHYINVRKKNPVEYSNCIL